MQYIRKARCFEWKRQRARFPVVSISYATDETKITPTNASPQTGNTRVAPVANQFSFFVKTKRRVYGLESLSIENLAGDVVRVELADGELRELAPRHYLARKSDGQQT